MRVVGRNFGDGCFRGKKDQTPRSCSARSLVRTRYGSGGHRLKGVACTPSFDRKEDLFKRDVLANLTRTSEAEMPTFLPTVGVGPLPREPVQRGRVAPRPETPAEHALCLRSHPAPGGVEIRKFVRERFSRVLCTWYVVCFRRRRGPFPVGLAVLLGPCRSPPGEAKIQSKLV